MERPHRLRILRTALDQVVDSALPFLPFFFAHLANSQNNQAIGQVSVVIELTTPSLVEVTLRHSTSR